MHFAKLGSFRWLVLLVLIGGFVERVFELLQGFKIDLVLLVELVPGPLFLLPSVGDCVEQFGVFGGKALKVGNGELNAVG